MGPCPSYLKVAAALLLVSRASADPRLPFRFGHSVYHFAALTIEPEDWNEAILRPNATGHFPLNGRDTSLPFPGEEIEGWAVDINVTADVRAHETLPGWYPRNDWATATQLRINAPPGLLNRTGNETVLVGDKEQWRLQFDYWTWFPATIDARAQNDDGSCQEALGDRCVQSLRWHYQRTWSDPPGERLNLATLDGCHSALGKSDSESRFDIGFDENFTKYDAHGSWSQTHALGNFSDYDDAVRRLHLVVLVWGWGEDGNTVRYPNVDIVCARANNVLPGSRVPPPVGGLAYWLWRLAVSVAMYFFGPLIV